MIFICFNVQYVNPGWRDKINWKKSCITSYCTCGDHSQHSDPVFGCPKTGPKVETTQEKATEENVFL